MAALSHKRNIFILALSLICFINTIEATSGSVRVVTKDELAKKNGEDSDELWLGILGKVYDVTEGKQFYGKGSPYSIFVGRDGSAAFATGDFTPEGAAKSIFETLTPQQLLAVSDWTQFYEKEEKYKFVGVLEGELYDKDGNPTEILKKIEETVAIERAALEEKKRERKLKKEQEKLEKTEEL